MTIEPKLMSPDELTDAREDIDAGHLWSNDDVSQLLAHIAAQEQRIRELEPVVEASIALRVSDTNTSWTRWRNAIDDYRNVPR